MSMLKITLKHSPIGHNETQKRTVRALGLRRLHQTVYQPDNPSIRGMIARIPHLLHVEVVQEPANQPAGKRTSRRAEQNGGRASRQAATRRTGAHAQALPTETEVPASEAQAAETPKPKRGKRQSAPITPNEEEAST
ncbi:50S ribosomal protein L30 [bacterium HR15]|nr:50S ribosomal protein L30 [bacterium HR15]